METNLRLDKVALQKGIIEMDVFMDRHFNELYEHYCNNGEMPYGVAKARTGDPNQWIAERIETELGI